MFFPLQFKKSKEMLKGGYGIHIPLYRSNAILNTVAENQSTNRELSKFLADLDFKIKIRTNS